MHKRQVHEHPASRSGRSRGLIRLAAWLVVALGATFAVAQSGPGVPGGPGFPFGQEGQGAPQAPPGFPGAPGNPGGGFGAGFPGGPGNSDRLEIVEQFDADGSGFLEAEEREAAKAYLESIGWNAGGRFGGGRGGAATTGGSTGVSLTPEDVENYAGTDFYDTSIIRTIFIETGFDDWETEMEAFYNTDVELPVTATIDGVVYEDVGMRFRGNSSYSMVSTGLKRPIRIKLDTVVSGQNVEGVRTIKLLNGINDASFLRTVLASAIMQDYIEAPRANFVRLVVNGENWGIYTNQQHYNTDFLRDHFGESGGVRWEVPGSPNGRGGMVYLGDDPDSYRDVYEIDNRDTEASWAALIELFRVLDETPADKLIEALEPILDIDGALGFLALDVVLANSDGFWTRASDYELYLDESGRFHIIPHDLNEALGASGMGGGGFGGGRGGGGGFGGGTGNTTLDPLVGLTDASKPLRSKLLAVPELQKRYLEIVLDIAENWLDWDVLGPIAEELHALIDEDVQVDTRKLMTNQQFEASLEGGTGSLRSFVDQRQAYLLSTVPALLDAIDVAAYAAPELTEASAVSAPAASASASELVTATAAAYGLQDGPSGWHLTAGSGQVVTFAEGDSEQAPVTAFTFDALGEGFGDNKLDQCVAIDGSSDFSIALSVYADTATADASGLAVRVNPNFHATLESCLDAMAQDAGGARLSGGRNNDDLDFPLGRADGGQWLTLDASTSPELRFAAADIPDGANYLRLSLRARDRSGVTRAASVYLADVSVTQGETADNLLVNGDFALP